jgi:hypothetical protein
MADDTDTGEDVIEEIAPRTIRFPAIEDNGRTVDSITLQPLNVGWLVDARKAGKDDLEQTLRLIQSSAGISPQLARKLLPQTIAKASEYFGRFLPSAPTADGPAPPPG